MNLEPADYAEVTSSLSRVADICCEGRIVSVLEGGYGRLASRRKSKPTSEAEPPMQDSLDRTSLARVCAAHVGTLAGLTRMYVDFIFVHGSGSC